MQRYPKSMMSRVCGRGREHRPWVCLHLPAVAGRKTFTPSHIHTFFAILLCEADALCKEKRANHSASKKRHEVVAEMSSKGTGVFPSLQWGNLCFVTAWMSLLCYATPDKTQFLGGLCIGALWPQCTPFSRPVLQEDPDEIQAHCVTALLLQLC